MPGSRFVSPRGSNPPRPRRSPPPAPLPRPRNLPANPFPLLLSLPQHIRDALWHSFLAHAHLSHALNLPIFPVTPGKAALSQARAVAPLLSDKAQQVFFKATAQAPPPLVPPGAYETAHVVAEAFYALQVAAQATSQLWPGVYCFTDEAGAYEVTKEVVEASARFTTHPAV